MNNKNKLDEALINIVNYLWLDELKHYKESDQTKEHIWHSINFIKEYLENKKELK